MTITFYFFIFFIVFNRKLLSFENVTLITYFDNKFKNTCVKVSFVVSSSNGGQFLDFNLDLCGPPLSSSNQSIGDFVVVPNPSNGQFDFKLPTGFNLDVIVLVHDLHGRTIYNKVFTNDSQRFHTIDLDNVSLGIYFLKV